MAMTPARRRSARRSGQWARSPLRTLGEQHKLTLLAMPATGAELKAQLDVALGGGRRLASLLQELRLGGWAERRTDGRWHSTPTAWRVLQADVDAAVEADRI